jgi:hypothetical protein
MYGLRLRPDRIVLRCRLRNPNQQIPFGLNLRLSFRPVPKTFQVRSGNLSLIGYAPLEVRRLIPKGYGQDDHDQFIDGHHFIHPEGWSRQSRQVRSGHVEDTCECRHAGYSASLRQSLRTLKQALERLRKEDSGGMCRMRCRDVKGFNPREVISHAEMYSATGVNDHRERRCPSPNRSHSPTRTFNRLASFGDEETLYLCPARLCWHSDYFLCLGSGVDEAGPRALRSPHPAHEALIAGFTKAGLILV